MHVTQQRVPFTSPLATSGVECDVSIGSRHTILKSLVLGLLGQVMGQGPRWLDSELVADQPLPWSGDVAYARVLETARGPLASLALLSHC